MRTARPLPSEAPRAFQPTADPASLWLTGQYDDALRMLRGAVLGRQGLMVLVGESGTGKTILAHALAVRVREDAVVVGRLLYPILEGMDLLAAVAEAFGLPTTFKDRDGFLEQFRRFVDDSLAAGRRVLLIVDEAQRLNRELLVELGRLPYGAEPGDAAALSVLFVGQRGLLDALRADAVEPDVLCHLRPLTREQTAEYVAHRLRAAGHRGRLFTPSALRKIWVVSEGIPRAANTLCIDALGSLRNTDRRAVTTAMIDRAPRKEEEAAASEVALSVSRPPLSAPSPHRSARRRRLASLAGAACVVLILAAAWAVKHNDLLPRFLAGPVATTASTVAEVAPATESETSVVSDAAGATAEATIESNETVAVATPLSLPERTQRPLAVASRPRAAAPAPTGVRADDAGDATSIIDWLLKGRGPGARSSVD